MAPCGKGSNPFPIVLTHGYPDSFYRFANIIAMLIDPVSDSSTCNLGPKCLAAGISRLWKSQNCSAVRVTPRGLRIKRSTPISSSRSCTWRLRAGCATRNSAAARVKCRLGLPPRSNVGAEVPMESHYAGKAWPCKEQSISRLKSDRGCCSRAEKKLLSQMKI
jgi:hypothetical protein